MQDWQGRFPDMPVGLVIDYMGSLGHGDFQGAAEQKEQAWPLRSKMIRDHNFGGICIRLLFVIGCILSLFFSCPSSSSSACLTFL